MKSKNGTHCIDRHIAIWSTRWCDFEWCEWRTAHTRHTSENYLLANVQFAVCGKFYYVNCSPALLFELCVHKWATSPSILCVVSFATRPLIKSWIINSKPSNTTCITANFRNSWHTHTHTSWWKCEYSVFTFVCLCIIDMILATRRNKSFMYAFYGVPFWSYKRMKRNKEGLT